MGVREVIPDVRQTCPRYPLVILKGNGRGFGSSTDEVVVMLSFWMLF